MAGGVCGGGRASVSEIAPTCEHERRRKRRNPFVLPLLMCAGRTREPRAARTRPGPLREREQKRGTERRRRKHEMRDGRVRGNVQSGWSRPEHWSDTFARTKNQQAKNGTRSNFKPAQLATSRVSFTPLTVREVEGGVGGGVVVVPLFYPSACARPDVCCRPGRRHVFDEQAVRNAQLCSNDADTC